MADFAYLFTAPIEEVNRRLKAVRREGLHGTGLVVSDAGVWRAEQGHIDRKSVV